MAERVPAEMQRIIVVGHAGSGKTIMAAWLSERLGLPHVELDALHWGPGWTSRGEDFLADIEIATQAPCWVLDGNYSESRRISWARADTIVWLDYGLPLVLWRLLKRTTRRVASGEELWNGNRETLGPAVFSRDSLFVYTLRTWRRRRRAYLRLRQGEEYGHLRWVWLRSLRATRLWREQITNSGETEKEPS